MDGSDTNIVFNRERALNAIMAQLKQASAGMVLTQHLSTPKTQRHYLAHGLQLKHLANPLALMLMTPEHFEEALDQAYRNTALLPDGERFRALMDKLATQHERYSAANTALGLAA